MWLVLFIKSTTKKNPGTDELHESKRLCEETLASGINIPIFLQLEPKFLENP